MRAGERKIVGIIGGMGPEATVDLMEKIIKHTVARGDEDHVHCLVDQNPQIPSRVASIMEHGESPGPHLARMAVKLEGAGADFLCIPCNTAHHWYGEVVEAVKIPVLNIIELAVAVVAAKLASGEKTVGILCTPGTHATRLYETACGKHGLTAIYADPPVEKELMDAINAIKAGQTGAETRQKLAKVARHVQDKGANALVLGCTELGVTGVETGLPVVDAAEALAVEVVKQAGAELC